MFEQLQSALNVPKLWQRSTVPFWDDEHISKGMLAAHLNPDIDAASRRLETIESSVAWIAKLLGSGCRVLDLGCGPGLYTKRLSDMGCSVTGVDYSRRSIEYAKAHDKKTEYRYQNYLELDEEDKYDAVLLIYCDYAALTLPERKILLSKVSRALKKDGLFIFDVFTDRHFEKEKKHNSWSSNPQGAFFSEKPHILLEDSYYYENGAVRADCYTIITKDGITKHIIWDTAFTKERLLEETSSFGLKLNCAYDDICGTPYSGESDTLCFVMEKR